MMDRVFDFGAFKLAVKDVPELVALRGVPQPPVHHPEICTLTHVGLSVDQAELLTYDKAVHFAVLLHDLGKGLTPRNKLPSHPGHEKDGVLLVQNVCARIPEVPGEWVALARLVCEFHTHCHRHEEMTTRALRRFFKDVGVFTHPERFEQFLLACEADSRGRFGFEKREYDQPRTLREKRDRMVEASKVTEMQEVKKRAMSDALYKRLLELPNEARLTILTKFCSECGDTHLDCSCGKDFETIFGKRYR